MRGANFVNNLCQISLVSCSSRRERNNELSLNIASIINIHMLYDRYAGLEEVCGDVLLRPTHPLPGGAEGQQQVKLYK